MACMKYVLAFGTFHDLSSIAPLESLTFLFSSQGGGVKIAGGDVTFNSCEISGNTASKVSARFWNFP